MTEFCQATAHTQLLPTEARWQEFFRGQGQKYKHNHNVDLSMVGCMVKTIHPFFVKKILNLVPTHPQLAKLTTLAAIREQAVAQPGPSPAGQALAAFSQLSTTVLEAGGSLGSYKASTLARTLQRDKASSRAAHQLPLASWYSS